MWLFLFVAWHWLSMSTVNGALRGISNLSRYQVYTTYVYAFIRTVEERGLVVLQPRNSDFGEEAEERSGLGWEQIEEPCCALVFLSHFCRRVSVST